VIAKSAINLIVLLCACTGHACADLSQSACPNLPQLRPGRRSRCHPRRARAEAHETGWPQVVVENRRVRRNSASIATKQPRPRTGHTLLLADLTSHAVSVSMVPDLQYDPIRTLPRSRLLWTLSQHSCGPGGPSASSVKETGRLAGKRPGGLSYASRDRGRAGTFLGAMLQKRAGPHDHVPIGSGARHHRPRRGRVDFIFASYASLKQNVDSGKLKMLAISSKQRLKELPDLRP